LNGKERRSARLIEQGLMTPAGLAAIELAVANGTWTALDAGDEQSGPDDLASALAAGDHRSHARGRAALASLQRVGEKGHPVLDRLGEAGRDTRQAHTCTAPAVCAGASVARTVELAEENIRVMFDRP
jgi:hypothetical protein